MPPLGSRHDAHREHHGKLHVVRREQLLVRGGVSGKITHERRTRPNLGAIVLLGQPQDRWKAKLQPAIGKLRRISRERGEDRLATKVCDPLLVVLLVRPRRTAGKLEHQADDRNAHPCCLTHDASRGTRGCSIHRSDCQEFRGGSSRRQKARDHPETRCRHPLLHRVLFAKPFFLTPTALPADLQGGEREFDQPPTDNRREAAMCSSEPRP